MLHAYAINKREGYSKQTYMTDIIALSIVCLAALIHASFQLSISTLTLMSGHALGSGRSHTRLVSLLGGFTAGAATMTTLLICTLGFLLQYFLAGEHVPQVVWAAACGLLFGVGVAVWLFYYRRGKGTILWLPRQTAEFLTERSKKTRNTGEAFALGLASVFGELLFISAPLLVSVLVLLPLSPDLQLLGIALYVGISLLSLLTVAILVSGGHKLSTIQRWREANKTFLQFAAGSALFILGFYLYVNEVLVTPVMTSGGIS